MLQGNFFCLPFSSFSSFFFLFFLQQLIDEFFCSQILVWSIAMDVFSLAFLQMDGLRRRRRIVRKIFSFCVLRPSGGDGFEGRMYSWMERMSGRGR